MQQLNAAKDTGISRDYASYDFPYRYNLTTAAKLVSEISLKGLLERYGDILWQPGSHKYNVNNFIGELHEILENPLFTVFSQDMLDGLIGKLRNRGNSNATINRKMAALRKLLRKAHKMGDIHSLPEFRREKEKAGRIRFLDHEEERRLFEAIGKESDVYQRLCIFLVDTGARLGEGLGLQWGDIVERRATFWVTKSGRSRSVPLTARAYDAVFASEKRGKGPFAGIDQQRFRTSWHAARHTVGLGSDDDVVPHILRHTCASRLVQGGIDIRRVQMWLGHQTLQMTMRYAHLASHDLDMCLPVLERHVK